MSNGNTAQPACAGAWKVQPGRSRLQRRICSDGYVGDYPYAGVVVVAEGLEPDDDPSAEIAVNTVRDVFAEGVAYGIEEALADAFREAADIIRRGGFAGCSAAAVAFCGTHAWFVSTGTCRVIKIEPESAAVLAMDESSAAASGTGRDHPEYSRKVRELSRWLGSGREELSAGHTRIRPDSLILAATPGVWMHMKDGSVSRRGVGRNLDAWVAGMVREARTAYRRQGGAAAAACCSTSGGGRIPVLPFVAVAAMVVLGVLLAAGVFDSRNPSEETDTFFSGADSTVQEVVMPLETDSSSRFWSYSRLSALAADPAGAPPDLSAYLPVAGVLAGGDSTAFSPDTFALAGNLNPDLQWENFRPGIYPLAGDTGAVFLAESLRERYPELPVIPLSTIITVREAEVAAMSPWLRNLEPGSASGVGVVVETGSSVAGGASWIRNYPVFINGNRANQGLGGGFLGDSVPGIPTGRNESCYRILIIP